MGDRFFVAISLDLQENVEIPRQVKLMFLLSPEVSSRMILVEEKSMMLLLLIIFFDEDFE